MIERLAAYANEHGAKALLLNRGREHVTAGDWDALQHGWRHARGGRISRVAFEPSATVSASSRPSLFLPFCR
jgi:hypothetical protein